MFTCTASGVLLSPYYKAQNLMDSWVVGGPVRTSYNKTTSEWFNRCCFSDWLKRIIILYLKALPEDEYKVIIGDNLASHMSHEAVELCAKHKIRYIFLPPNSTGLLQPFDVGVYGPVKRKWYKVLTDWKLSLGRKFTSLPKQHFPNLLSSLLDQLGDVTDLVKSASGIFPIDTDQIIRKIFNKEPSVLQTREHVPDLVLERL